MQWLSKPRGSYQADVTQPENGQNTKGENKVPEEFMKGCIYSAVLRREGGKLKADPAGDRIEGLLFLLVFCIFSIFYSKEF